MIVKKDNPIVYIQYKPYKSYRIIIGIQWFIIVSLVIKLIT